MLGTGMVLGGILPIAFLGKARPSGEPADEPRAADDREEDRPEGP